VLVASIRNVVHRSGRISWQARWGDRSDSLRSKNFPRRIDAERFLIASRLGHGSVKIVLDVHGNLYEGLDCDAADTPIPSWDDPDVDALWSRRNRHRDQGGLLTEKVRAQEASVVLERPKRSGRFERIGAHEENSGLVVGATGIEPVTSAV
jgi:hypothetical protein